MPGSDSLGKDQPSSIEKIEVSAHSLIVIELTEDQLEGKYTVISYLLSINGIHVQTHAHINGDATGNAFVDKEFTCQNQIPHFQL